MSIAELSNRTVYRGQKLLFIGTIKATIKNVYVNGKSSHSGYFSPTTKPIFRSESARFVLFIQMSKEMWDFDAEGAGEIMFNKVVNGFLLDLFKRWMRINARHLVTIILFARMAQDGDATLDESRRTNSTGAADHATANVRDYYRVVVSEMASGDWINILYQLKKEFRAFRRDVSLIPKSSGHLLNPDDKDFTSDDNDLVIAGKPCSASRGNILEAINLAAGQFARDYIDRDLVRTGISVVVVTAGTGVFEVDYNMLKLTTDTLIGSGIGIDLVCLSPMPLHSVPLFKYRKPRTASGPGHGNADGQRGASVTSSFTDNYDKTPRQFQANFGSAIRSASSAASTGPAPLADDDDDNWRYAMPHWLDISFWSGPSDEITELMNPVKSVRSKTKARQKQSAFALRCRMYELQMMGVMDNDLGGITLPYMEETAFYPSQLKDHLEGPSTVVVRERSTASTSTEAGSGSIENNAAKATTTGSLNQLQQQWMDLYDKNVYASSPEAQGHPEIINHSTRLVSSSKRISPAPTFNDAYLSASYRSVGSSMMRPSRLSPEGSVRSLARQQTRNSENQSPFGSYRQASPETRPQLRADILYRQQHPINISTPRRSGLPDNHPYSNHTTPNDSPVVSRGNTPPSRGIVPPLLNQVLGYSKPTPTKPATSNRTSWFFRNLSFGGKGVGAAAAAKATTSLNTINATAAQSTSSISPISPPSSDSTQTGSIAEKLVSTRDPEVERPSRPITIKSATRSNASGDLPSSADTGRSAETVRGPRTPRASTPYQQRSTPKDPGSTFLLAGSRALTDTLGPKIDVTSSSGAKLPSTLSPTSAIAPWAVLVNPCNPRKNSANLASQFRRWQHVFPKQLKTASVKWKSLCSPAAVPLTNEYFPTAEQLATEYNESPYKIAQNDDDEALDAPKSRETLVRELIAFRLSHGFQIIVGSAVAEVTGGREQDLSSILHSEYMCNDGDTVFMCLGNTIHQLVCAAGGEVEVKRFTRMPTTALESSAGIDKPLTYKAFIRTAFEDRYKPREVILRPARKEYNWNFIDTFLAGYHDEFSEILRFWRARFVLIPVEIPAVHRRALPVLTEDSEEEIRLEGIRKLTQLWQRNRYLPPEERFFQTSTSKKQKDPNPLAIEYHTRDPSAIVAGGPDSTLLQALENDFQTSLFAGSEQYHTSNIDIKRLAEDLQGEKGIPMLDRRWHWRLHYNCFLGFDLTSWLLTNFRDIETRDEAVELGNKLMEKGLFHHVQKRHQFRDGNFFFQIAPEYRAPRPDSKSSWFGIKKTPDRSVPSTPASEGPRSSPLLGRGSVKSRHSVDDSDSVHGSEKEVPQKRKVTLSRVMRYDVDSRRRSYRQELISLHYDRLHNPDNCYHIRIDWMNVTAKLIEDAIVTWATSVEKYGLKLVEVPIAEASNISDHHPFRSPYMVKLALAPPPVQSEQLWDPSHFSPQPKIDKFAYHKALLRHLNFVLDMEATSAFPSDVEVTYSWGKPDYKYTQFIHRSGGVLAQITNEGDFILLANRLAHNRAKDAVKFRPTDPYDHKRPTATSTTPSTPAIDKVIKSPFSSPLARPVQDSSLLHTALQTTALQTPLRDVPPSAQTPEQVKDEVETFCADPIRLRHFYEKALHPTPSASPHTLPVPESNIPSLGLPPSISIQDASPAVSPGWAGLGIEGSGPGIRTPRIETATMIARRQGYEMGASGAGSASTGGSGGSLVKRGSAESASTVSEHRRQGSGSSGPSETGGT